MEPIEYPATVSVGIGLGSNNPHRQAFDVAVSNVMSTDIAKETYLQIVDGLPTAAVLRDRPAAFIHGMHPIFTEHTQLCPGVEERLQEIRDKELNIENIRIQSKVFTHGFFHLVNHNLEYAELIPVQLVGRYLSSSPRSRAFNAALIELSAVAVHEIASEIYKLGGRFHDDRDPLFTWQYQDPNPLACWEHNRPTLLFHPWYCDDDQYPNGVADVVGYWAEMSIFGGVVLFDRLKLYPELENEPDSLWLHPSRKQVTYRICKLNDDQKLDLISFLTNDSPDLTTLPIHPNRANDIRQDPEDALETTGIYRDSWERREPPPGSFDRRLRDVSSTLDYPDMSDLWESKRRALEKDRAYEKMLRQEEGINESDDSSVPPPPEIPEGTGYPDHSHPF